MKEKEKTHVINNLVVYFASICGWLVFFKHETFFRTWNIMENREKNKHQQQRLEKNNNGPDFGVWVFFSKICLFLFSILFYTDFKKKKPIDISRNHMHVQCGTVFFYLHGIGKISKQFVFFFSINRRRRFPTNQTHLIIIDDCNSWWFMNILL